MYIISFINVIFIFNKIYIKMGNCQCDCSSPEEDTKIVLESQVVAPKKNNKLQAKNKFALLDDSQSSELNVMTYQKEKTLQVETTANSNTIQNNETVEEVPNENNDGQQIVIKDEVEEEINEIVCDDAHPNEQIQALNKVATEVKRSNVEKEELVVEEVHMNEFVDTYEGGKCI